MDRPVIAPGGYPPPSMMSVSEAVARHRSVRAFLDRPVDREEVLNILRRAARAPSGGNLQPWAITTIDGERLSDLKTLMRGRCSEHPDGEPLEFSFYRALSCRLHRTAYAQRRNPIWRSRHRSTRRAGPADLDTHENFQFFGAPFGVFCSLERSFEAYQWLDLGIDPADRPAPAYGGGIRQLPSSRLGDVRTHGQTLSAQPA